MEKAYFFWIDLWLGDQPLFIQFPHLYRLSFDKSVYVANKGACIDRKWTWRWCWNRVPSVMRWKCRHMCSCKIMLQTH